MSSDALKTKNYLLDENTPFAITEAYKSLRTNIMFSLPDAGGKAIGITSSHRSERKTSNCLNLAISFADIGKKCVVIDCDMRLPTVATRLKVKPAPGVSNILIKQCEPREAIVNVAENLDVIPAGRIPKDPTGLLSSKIFAEFLQALKSVYDYVFVDLPPVATVTDAAIIAPHIDGYLMAVCHENTQYKEVSESVRLLRMSGADILGFIYNAAPVTTKKYYSKKYYKK